MEEKKKTYYWIIPVVIGVFLFIGFAVVTFIWLIFKGVNGILTGVSKDIQGSWLCNNTLNVDITQDRINMYSNNRVDVINSTYKLNRFTTTNGNNLYELTLKTFKISGERHNDITKYTIEKYNDATEMKMINESTGVIYRCKKR